MCGGNSSRRRQTGATPGLPDCFAQDQLVEFSCTQSLRRFFPWTVLVETFEERGKRTTAYPESVRPSSSSCAGTCPFFSSSVAFGRSGSAGCSPQLPKCHCLSRFFGGVWR